MYKKAWCTCKLVVLLNKPIAVLTFSLPSPSSLLKLPIGNLTTRQHGNENGKKAICFDWQNNNFARASRFWQPRQPFPFSFCDHRYSPLKFNSWRYRQHLKNKNICDKDAEAWSRANSFFGWRFRYRCRRRCLSSLKLTQLHGGYKRLAWCWKVHSCHEYTAVLDHFCAKVVTSCLYPNTKCSYRVTEQVTNKFHQGMLTIMNFMVIFSGQTALKLEKVARFLPCLATDDSKQFEITKLGHYFLEFNWCKKKFYLYKKLANRVPLIAIVIEKLTRPQLLGMFTFGSLA